MRAHSCTGRVAEMHRLGASSIAYAYTIVECSALFANMCRLEDVTFEVNHMLIVVQLMTKYYTHPAYGAPNETKMLLVRMTSSKQETLNTRPVKRVYSTRPVLLNTRAFPVNAGATVQKV